MESLRLGRRPESASALKPPALSLQELNLDPHVLLALDFRQDDLVPSTRGDLVKRSDRTIAIFADACALIGYRVGVSVSIASLTDRETGKDVLDVAYIQRQMDILGSYAERRRLHREYFGRPGDYAHCSAELRRDMTEFSLGRRGSIREQRVSERQETFGGRLGLAAERSAVFVAEQTLGRVVYAAINALPERGKRRP